MTNADGGRVLIVDDDPSTHAALATYLRHAGLDVCDAFSGEEALEVIVAQRPHLVLLDVQMPGVDGFETLRRFKAMPGIRDIPVLMVTSMDRQHLKVRGLELGAEDYVLKPFDRAELLARIRAVLRRARRSFSSDAFMAGRLEEIGILEVLQTLDGTGRAARVTVPALEAVIELQKGTLVRVTLGRWTGQAALERLLLLQQGSFSVTPADNQAAPGDARLMPALLAAATVVDEARDLLAAPLRDNPRVQRPHAGAADTRAPARVFRLLAEMDGDLRDCARSINAEFESGQLLPLDDRTAGP
ncbi:MAG: response regulator [Deltaproteobacteria bacterium]|nr:response regulator [Deltaproteobacteria bacterium]